MSAVDSDETSRELAPPAPAAPAGRHRAPRDGRWYARQARDHGIWMTVPSALVLVALVAAATAGGGIRHQLSLSFVRQPSGGVALFFAEPDRLPSSFTPGQDIRFAVSVSNDMRTQQDFPFTVAAGAAGKPQTVLAHGTVHVPAGGAAGTPVVVRPPHAPGGKTVVTVTLAGRSEHIHFAMTEKRGAP